jgi:GGDEF domain-containing protein
VNEDVSYPAGDHVIQVAARNAQRTAARFGGTAYRASGRRLAVLAPLNGDHGADDVVNGLLAEFASGPVVRAGVAVWGPGDRASDVLARARRSLLRPEP